MICLGRLKSHLFASLMNRAFTGDAGGLFCH